jgi:MFS family permease
MFGRLPLYHASAFFFVVFNIACAVSGSLSQLIVFRFFAGSFGAAPLALGKNTLDLTFFGSCANCYILSGGGTIADVIPREQRATAMSIWVLGPTVGPVIGGLASRFMYSIL